ncbi:hypothetical protein [Vibrio sp. SCSIO 43155]|uniref:hypothetical protein n=1 Tax=Vibrio sp. SCSIO 43155 TaxID=2819099 RepID=UPI0020760236|nr:hypothetical protein [Vibrio sp. SCSIO 43155]USD58545.1 hypothetical protein J4N44_28020 [Vibrio sp. SCSIO 43155]
MNLKKIKLLPLTACISLGLFSFTADASSVTGTTSKLSMSEQANRELLKSYFQASEITLGPRERSQPFYPVIGGRVNGLDTCDGNISYTIQNIFSDGRLKQIYERFQDVLDAMMSSGGAIYLSSLYIQKSNPGLYSLLTNGINIGLDDFFAAVGDCESMLRSASSFIPSHYDENSQMTKLDNAIKDSKIEWDRIDITQFFSSDPKGSVGVGNTMADISDDGVRFYNRDGDIVDGIGGSEPGDEPWNIIRTASMKGYCILRGIPAQSCNVNSVAAPTGANSWDISKDPMFEFYFGNKSVSETEKLKKIMDLAFELYGEIAVLDCDTCSSTTISGKGLYTHFTEQRAEIAHTLETILTYSAPVAQVTSEQLKSISAPNGIMIQLSHIKGLDLLRRDKELQEKFINGLSMDVAYARTLWIGQFYIDSFSHMTKDELANKYKRQDIYGTLRDDAKSQLNEFRENIRMQPFKPGQYIRGLSAVTSFEGNLDALADWMERQK